MVSVMGKVVAADRFGLVGKLLENKYRVDAAVAEGGFGIVYAGFHLLLAKPLAIKILKRPPAADTVGWSERVGRFLEEGRLMARLRHPAVVGVIDAGLTATDRDPEGVAWIVMEWLEGETLADDLARRRERGEHGRSRAEVFALLRPAIEAMAEAHEAGIVHRDLKPSNLMLVPGKHGTSVRILDFGIAKVVQVDAAAPSTTQTDAPYRAFSLAYAAPEQLSGARTGPWTDVHALGVVLTEALCGDHADAQDDVDAHYRAAFAPNRPTPASLGVEVGAWEPILLRAQAVDPRDRYASAGELLAALDEVEQVPPRRRAAAPGDRRPGARSPAPGPTRVMRSPARTPRIWFRVGLATAAVALLVVAWQLVAARGDHPADATPIPPRCTSNAACSRPGAPAICRPEAGCVALRSADCEPLADVRALNSDATIWIGAMFPRTGPDATTFGVYEANAVELARRDFSQIMSGSSTPGALARARPFGVVLCDDAVDPHRAATHLVEHVGVPAVIGFYSSVEAIDLATSLFLPKRVLAIASLNTNPLVTSVPQPAGVPRLVWRTTYNSADAAAALSAFVARELERPLRDASGDRGGIRVALLRPRNAAGAALSDAFFKTLRFNGKSVLDNGSAYRELTFEAEAPKSSPEYVELRRELLAFTPHIVLYAGNAAIIEALFAPLEDQWPRAVAHRPRYVSIAQFPRELLDFVGASRARRGRFFGITPVASTPANARLVTHYNEVFPTKITRTFSPNASYDAFYLLAYASYAIPPDEAVTGERLARAIGKLVPPGRPIEVGIAGIFDAYAALSKNESIDLTGATGNLDFDLAAGEAAFDQAILCVGVDDHGKASEGIESGLVYSATWKQLAGAMRCP
jgi:serine/threonine protein kinase